MNYTFKPLILTIACFSALSAQAKIAILAWDSKVQLTGCDSLIEQSGFKEHGQTGPVIPLKYARKKDDGRLDLVLSSDPDAKKMRTYYATYDGRNYVPKGCELCRAYNFSACFLGQISWVNLQAETYVHRSWYGQRTPF